MIIKIDMFGGHGLFLILSKIKFDFRFNQHVAKRKKNVDTGENTDCSKHG